jgi:hypothetical protein
MSINSLELQAPPTSKSYSADVGCSDWQAPLGHSSAGRDLPGDRSVRHLLPTSDGLRLTCCCQLASGSGLVNRMMRLSGAPTIPA